MNRRRSEEENVTVTVNILDRDYQVSCGADELDALERSASYLDRQMREIRASGKIVGIERIAVMAALNLTHDLLSSSGSLDSMRHRTQQEVDRLGDRVDRALEEMEQRRRS